MKNYIAPSIVTHEIIGTTMAKMLAFVENNSSNQKGLHTNLGFNL